MIRAALAVWVLLLTACTSLSYEETADGATRLSYTSTREIENLRAEKSADGVSVAVGSASGAEGFAEAVAEKIVDKIPTSIGVELR